MLGNTAKEENRSESTAEPIKKPTGKKLDQAQVRELYRPADNETIAILHAICGRLGHMATGNHKYLLSVEFTEALDDLMRLLLTDEGPIIIKLGEMMVMEKHLLPMLLVLRRDRFEDSLLTLLDLILLFTSSEIVADRAPAPLLLDYRRQYKRLFHDQKPFSFLLDLLVTTVAYDEDNFERDQELMSRIFKLIRNILIIPDHNCSPITGGSFVFGAAFGRQERVIEALRDTRMLELLFVSCSSLNDPRDKRVFGPHVFTLLEIFQSIFTHFSPDELASFASPDDEDGPRRDDIERSLYSGDGQVKRPIRHARFSASFTVKLSTGDDYIVNANCLNNGVSLDSGKRTQHRQKRINIEDFGEHAASARASEKRTTCQIALEFLSGNFLQDLVACLAPITHRSFRNDGMQDAAQNRLLWNFFRLLTWFLRFGRKVHVSFLERTAAFPNARPPSLDLASLFPLVDGDNLARLARMLPRLLTEKQLRLLLSVVHYFREALRLVDFINLASNSSHKDHALQIQNIFFYRHDVIDVFRILIQNSQRLNTKGLAMLVETNYVLLKILEKYCKDKGHVYVAGGRATIRIASGQDEDEDEMLQQSEKEFFFDIFLAGYANEAVCNAYFRLLRDARLLEPTINRYVASMIARIISELKMPQFFYRISYLNAFHSILTENNTKWRSQNGSLIKIASHIAMNFMSLLQRDPIWIVQTFFGPSVTGSGSGRQMLNSKAIDTSMNLINDQVKLISLDEHWSKDERLRWLVNILVDSELTQALTWLISILFDAAALRASKQLPNEDTLNEHDWASSSEAFDLIPHTSSLKEAFKDQYFCTLLKETLCVHPVASHPSWNIPSTVPADALIKIASDIQAIMRDSINVANPSCSDAETGQEVKVARGTRRVIIESDDENGPIEDHVSVCRWSETSKRKPAKNMGGPKVKAKKTDSVSQKVSASQSKLSRDFIDTGDEGDWLGNATKATTAAVSKVSRIGSMAAQNSDPEDSQLDSDIPSGGERESTGLIVSRWQQLKMENSFLTSPLGAVEDVTELPNDKNPNITSEHAGGNHHPVIIKKRLPLAIYSDEE